MCRTGLCRFGFGNWIFLLCCLHLFTYVKGGEDSKSDLGVRFTLEPTDQVTLEGERVVLSCSAASHDHVRITWRFSSEGIPTVDQTLSPNDRLRKQFPNGTLDIEKMTPEVVGRYQCVATAEGVGTIVSKIATVSIVELAIVSAGPRWVTAPVGGAALLPCGVRAVQPALAAVLVAPVAPSTPAVAPPVANRGYGTKVHNPPTVVVNVTWLHNGLAVRAGGGRAAVSPGGALELEPLQARDAGRYRCELLPALAGEDIELRVTPAPTAEYPPRFVATPLSQTVIEGAPVMLDCAAVGNPRPEITWLFNGVEIDVNDLDSRFHRWGSGSLALSRARGTDSGGYTCRAHSILDSLDAHAALSVQMYPRVSGGGAVEAAVGGEAELACGVRGRPAPRAAWYKDGEPLTHSARGLPLRDGSSLRIAGVMRLDAGMFQCFASSPAGTAHADYRLTVTPPGEGSNSDNYTHSSSSPNTTTSSKYKKRVLHTKSNLTQDIFNSLVSSGNFLDHNTDSSIDDFDFLGETSSAFTSGPELELDYNYDTDLSNSNVSFHAAKGMDLDKLIVNSTMISPPMDLKAVIVKHRFVTLTWEGSEAVNDEVTGYTIVYNVKGSERERYLRGSASSREMNVASLEPNTTYCFRAFATTARFASESTPVVEVRTAGVEVEEEAVRSLRAETVSPRAVRVLWGADGRTKKYHVRYTELETNEEHTLEVDSSSSLVNVTLSPLHPGSTYSVRVWAGPAGGGAAGGGASIRIHAPTAPPSAPPTDIVAKPSSQQSITVSWEPPPARSHHGPLTGYKLRYRPDSPPSTSRRKADSITTPADVRRAEITALETGVTYQIRVCALNANGSGPFSEWVSARPAGGGPPPSVPEAPPPLTTRAGRDWISVWWAGGAGVGGAPGGWEVGWGLGVPDEHSTSLPATQRSHVIQGLESNSEYVISLRGSNSQGLGPAVYATVRTKPAAHSGDQLDELDDELDDELTDEITEQYAQPELLPPVGVKVIMLSGTTAVVYWTDPTLPKGQLVSDGRRYVVRAVSAGRPRLYNATQPSLMLDDLRPHTKYEFAVKLIKGGGSSQWSLLVSNTTLEAVPASPPREVRVSPAPVAQSPALLVTWTPPARPNGHITGYVVTYALESESGSWRSLSVGAPPAVLAGLRPRSRYLVRVQAATRRGLGPPSAPLPARAPPEAGGLPAATSAWLWASAGGAVAVLALAAALALSLCCRKTPSLEPTTSTYQKSSASAAIKPPDLWIHHDQMELKHMDKSLHSSISKMSAGSTDGGAGCGGGVGGAGMGVGVGVGGGGGCRAEYEPARALPASLDRRHYVPAYVEECASRGSSCERSVSRSSTSNCRRCDVLSMTGVGVGCAATCDRRRLAPPDQSTPLLAGVGPLSPHASLASLPPPCVGGACGAEGCARERGHYVAYEPLGHYTHRDSLSGESTAVSGGVGSLGGIVGGPSSVVGGGGAAGSLRRPFLDNASDHSTPAHSRAGSGRDTSPYKKSASSSPGHLPNRLQLGGSVGHCSSELEPLTPSRSTERLQREMQNLEGLMKDLSAITQQQFHC